MLTILREHELSASIQRREFLKLSTSSLVGGRALRFPLRNADAAFALPIEYLVSQFETGDGQVYTRSDTDYYRLMTFYNKRFECITPEVLIYCRTAKGVAKARLAANNGVQRDPAGRTW